MSSREPAKVIGGVGLDIDSLLVGQKNVHRFSEPATQLEIEKKKKHFHKLQCSDNIMMLCGAREGVFVCVARD